MKLRRPTQLKKVVRLAASVSAVLLTALALSGCAATKSAAPAPSGTQFTEQEQGAENSWGNKNNQADSSSDVGASEGHQLPANTENAAYAKLKKKLTVELDSYGEKVAVAVASVNGDNTIAINGDKQFVSASMIKLLVLAEFIDEVDTGKISLSDVYSSEKADIVGGTGVIQNEPVGTKYTYDDLARHMIMYSDNTATNVLIDIMGMSTINAKAEELGLENTKLNRKMMDLHSEVENYISANDAAKVLAGIAAGELGSKRMRKKAMGYLRKQTDNAGLAQGLPDDVVFAHKTGSLNSIRHDGGIVECRSPYVIVVLTKIGAQPANNLMKSIASTTYQLLEN